MLFAFQMNGLQIYQSRSNLQGLSSYPPRTGGRDPGNEDDAEMSSLVIRPIESNQYTAIQLLKTVHVLFTENEIYEPIKAFRSSKVFILQCESQKVNKGLKYSIIKYIRHNCS